MSLLGTFLFLCLPLPPVWDIIPEFSIFLAMAPLIPIYLVLVNKYFSEVPEGSCVDFVIVVVVNVVVVSCLLLLVKFCLIVVNKCKSEDPGGYIFISAKVVENC